MLTRMLQPKPDDILGRMFKIGCCREGESSLHFDFRLALPFLMHCQSLLPTLPAWLSFL